MIRFVLLTLFIYGCDGAKILAVYPTPSISHQVVFRSLTLELLKRGHEMVVITTDPIYHKGQTPANLTEIDFHDRSYKFYRERIQKSSIRKEDPKDFLTQAKVLIETSIEEFLNQMASDEVQNLLNDTNTKFDLLILEAYLTPALALTHVFKVPTIQISSCGSTNDNLKAVGAPSHPLLHPTIFNQKVYNLTFWDKLTIIYNEIYVQNIVLNPMETKLESRLRDIFGHSMPPLSDLKNNVDMLFLNIHPIWELNRPVPPNVIFLGGLHQKPEKELPKDLKEYLDSSKNGVIYISFGTNVDPASLPPHKIHTMVNVLSKLPYDILWKWNTDEMQGRSANIRISKWLPQSDLLRHPKVKLFITQGGLQSTDEAITAGVPVIGIPFFGDQWYNVEQYVHHKIGVHVDIDTITEEKFGKALEEVLNNESYRRNMLRLRAIVTDEPQTPLDRAVWWTEYVIRHKGAKHLRSPSANITWRQYLELDLVFFLLAVFIFIASIIIFILYKLVKFFKNNVLRISKLKKS